MRARTFDYDKTIPCACVGGRVSCGVLGICVIDKDNLEIGFSDKKSRYRGHTRNPHICLDRKSAKQLISSLQKALKEGKI